MTTRDLAMYILASLTVCAVMFGVLPPMLNAKNTLENALGAGTAIVTVVAAVLLVHSTYQKSRASAELKRRLKDPDQQSDQ